jgi:hypothetical protein
LHAVYRPLSPVPNSESSINHSCSRP